ncbi:UTP--glucose-1-phosphate uridylyltransferase [Enhygromyxa salina]|uniref:UTP--glucose-1-phosphate uridylyltransferase n=1 Tax=Enhygromyxa salina TaxID=215803 RepID=A0A0C2CR20_9BACT|nr:UTP--glucose-1-phosphate uridylyltransferase [Enhygromyxa salina]KIG13621.1 UTP--glucose-1-phosphate uridylyltransferase [Enhygromyxa salina]
MELRPSVAGYAFDAAAFAALRLRLSSGSLSEATARLPVAPEPLTSLVPPPLRDFRTFAGRAGARVSEASRNLGSAAQRGRLALRHGRAAVLILNGGMATRFGGRPKGVVPVVQGEPETFLWVKLAQIARLIREYDATIPVVLMHSFATQAASRVHLHDIDWAGIPRDMRFEFSQSIMPRVGTDAVPLQDLPGAAALPDSLLYCAPGHGDTLLRLRASGILRDLRQAGVEHLLVSNVDNLGAELDPILLGGHIQAVDAGAHMSVEVVRRDGDKGGCVAVLGGRPVIIEGFRMPEDISLDAYPQFNTNTLWFWLSAIDRDFDLDWFPIERVVAGPQGKAMPVVQFEQLIGQVTEHLEAHYFEVDRERRFLPIKTRDDLTEAAPRMRALVKRLRSKDL